MAFFDSATINVNGSKWAALINIVLFIFGFFMPTIFNHTPVGALHGFIPYEVGAFVLTGIQFYVGATDTVPTHANWKVALQAASAIANFIGPAIFIAITNNG